MKLLDWKPAYSLGIPEIDFEHRELIREINEAYAHIEADSHPDAIEASLEEIYALIASHFALEERHMRQLGYAGFDSHKDDHEELLDEIRGLMDDYARDSEAGRVRLQERLADWFSVHFSTFDARLHKTLEGHGPGAR